MTPTLCSSKQYMVTPDIYFAWIGLMIGKSVLHDGSTLNGVRGMEADFGFFTVIGNSSADQNHVVCENQSPTEDVQRKITFWLTSVSTLIKALVFLWTVNIPHYSQYSHSIILTSCLNR